jgi:hypothetical protein
MIKFFFALATAAWALLSITTMAAAAEKTAVVAGNDVSRIATLRDVSIEKWRGFWRSSQQFKRHAARRGCGN